MKVLFIAGRYPTPENRVLGTFIRDHALSASLYNEVAVIYGYKDRGQKEIYRFFKEKEDGIPIIRFTYRKPLLAWDSFSTYVEGVHQAFQQLRDEGFSPDIVHANIFFTAVPANLIKQRYGIPFVITEHRSVFLLHLLNKTDLKRAFTMQEATRIMPVSNTLQKGIESYGIKGLFEVVPNTIDMNIFYPDVCKGKGEGVKNIITVASLRAAKGIDDLLKGVRELKRMRNNFQLRIIGNGKLKEDYMRMAEEFNISSYVSFLGQKNKDEVAKLIRQSDFFVLPTHHETFGCVFAEAMACGLPVVGTKVGAVPEFFGNPDYGVLIPPHDINLLSQTLDYMLNNFQKYDPSKISRYARENFSYQEVGKRLSRIYLEAVNTL